MAAYWLSRCKVNDPVEYKKYTDLVPGIIAKYGGKVLARGGKYQIMEGTDKFHRFVVIEFPSVEAACNATILAIQSGIPVARIEILDARDHDHRNFRKKRIGAYFPAHRITVAAGHHNVEKHKVRTAGMYLREGFLAIRCSLGHVPRL